MPTINQLSAVDSVSSSDQVPIYSSGNGDARKASMSVIKEYMTAGIYEDTGLVSQYSAPSATAFSVQVTDSDQNTWLILTPVAGYADGEIVMPAVANCVDGQEFLMNCTQSVTTFVVDGNGATVTGWPATLAANAFFRLRFDAVTDTWYRVG